MKSITICIFVLASLVGNTSGLFSSKKNKKNSEVHSEFVLDSFNVDNPTVAIKLVKEGEIEFQLVTFSGIVVQKFEFGSKKAGDYCGTIDIDYAIKPGSYALIMYVNGEFHADKEIEIRPRIASE